MLVKARGETYNITKPASLFVRCWCQSYIVVVFLTEALDATTSAPVTYRLSWGGKSTPNLSSLALPATLRALPNLSPFGCELVTASVAIGDRRGHCSAECAETASQRFFLWTPK